ncbi:hypothetical protein LUZ60_011961 [Juncus effusus]|nr:hypothetical protein LUZ60_011961 [Juncus effusus]
MAFHTRSTSLPTKSHSYVLKAEAELHKLRASLSSSSHTSEIILDALQGVCNLYEYVNDILSMSSNQNRISHSKQRRLVDQELEKSINLLDICHTSKDNLGEIKIFIEDLESALRRCGSKSMKSKKRDCIQLVKKATKDVKKQTIRRSESIKGDSEVLVLLKDARAVTISLFESLFSFLSKQITWQKSGKWSFLHKSNVTSKEDAFEISSLRVNVEELHNGLECLFRHMVRCRVSLLNNCSL